MQALCTTLLLILSLACAALAPAGQYDAPKYTDPPETKSADQLRWEELVAPKYKPWPATRYVQEDPALPRVLLIGDSISVGYTTRTQEALKDKVNVWRVPINGGSTQVGLENLEQWLAWRDKWDVIHFNFGLHDLSREVDGRADVAGPNRIPVEEYAANLETIVLRLKQTGAELVWATTTPVPEGAPGRVPGDEKLYNEAAAKVMQKHGVRINDLNAFITPHLAMAQPPADVHFKDEGNDLFAPHIAGVILEALAARAEPMKPAAPASKPTSRPAAP
jgi:acyl-CoA thioesterase-1